MIYVNSALNDLIGSNIQEKEEWLKYVEERVNTTIEINELQTLLELGNKMKIEIPEFVTKELENSFDFAKIVRRHLSEKNSINEIYNLLEYSKQFKVKTEEFSQLEDIIKKSNLWLSKVNELENKTVQFKILQSLYNDGRSLPLNFEQYEDIKSRYLRAQKWQEKFQVLPKHSKTRQQGVNTSKKRSKDSIGKNEKCTIQGLKELLEDAEEIKFTSSDVQALQNNLDRLVEAESRILLTLEDTQIPKTKELLTECVNILDSLKFTTDLYDVIIAKLDYFDWKDKKEYYMGNKTLKMKHLKNLVKEANQKNLTILPEINKFIELFERIDTWMDTMVEILYKDENEFANSDENSIDAEITHTDKKKHKKEKKHTRFDIKDLYSLYNQGKAFEIKTEEIEHVLGKCEEFFEFYDECKMIKCINNGNIENSNYQCNYQKLIILRKQISSYNIKCEEFDMIDTQINLMQNWIEDHCIFMKKLHILYDLEFFKDIDLNSIESRQEIVETLENFLRYGDTFFENIVDLMSRVPNFAKSSFEYLELHKILDGAERMMEDYPLIPNNVVQVTSNTNQKNLYSWSLDKIQNFILELYKFPIKKSYFTQILCIYRAKSWAHIAASKEKKSLLEAETMLKEASNLNLDSVEVEAIKQQISRTRDWIRQSKKLINSSENISYENLKNIIKEGAQLPLQTGELEDLFHFQASIDNDIFQARSFLQKEHSFYDLSEFVEKVRYLSIEVPEFEIIIKLKLFCHEWKEIANKILSSRKLCQLFFKESEVVFNNNAPSVRFESDEENDNLISRKVNSSCRQDENGTPIKKRKISEEKHTNIYVNPKIENANINIINNNYYIDNSGKKSSNSELSPISKKQKTKASKDNENIMNIVNTIPNKTSKVTNGKISYSPKKKNNLSSNLTISEFYNLSFTSMENYPTPISQSTLQNMKINLKKFNNLSYDEKLKFISQTVILREDTPNEKYCICRKGDDSVNYMIMCENCKEWFHGLCLNIGKSTADKISQYLCIACSKRKDVANSTYHSDFVNLKRMSYPSFVEFVKEGESLPIFLEELTPLQNILKQIEIWFCNFKEILADIKESEKNLNPNKIPILKIDECIEKKLIDLYLESEGFPVEIESANNLIIILKQFDWFKDAIKCLENKKFSEKINKRVIYSAYSIFNKDFIPFSTEIENIFFPNIVEKGLKILNEISKNYEKYVTILNSFKTKHDKKDIEIVEELIPQIDANNTKQPNYIIDMVNQYFEWCHSLKNIFSSETFKHDIFKDLIEKAKSFIFKSSLLEKFRRIALNFMVDQIDYYHSLLFEDNSSKPPRKYKKKSTSSFNV